MSTFFITIAILSILSIWLTVKFWRWVFGVNRSNKNQKAILAELKRQNDLKEQELRLRNTSDAALANEDNKATPVIAEENQIEVLGVTSVRPQYVPQMDKSKLGKGLSINDVYRRY